MRRPWPSKERGAEAARARATLSRLAPPRKPAGLVQLRVMTALAVAQHPQFRAALSADPAMPGPAMLARPASQD